MQYTDGYTGEVVSEEKYKRYMQYTATRAVVLDSETTVFYVHRDMNSQFCECKKCAKYRGFDKQTVTN